MSVRLMMTAWNAYPAVNPAAGSAVGGLETFAWSLAKSLAQSDKVTVLFCVRESRAPASLTVDGVQISALVEPFGKIRNNVARSLIRTARFPWISLRKLDPNLIWQIPLLAIRRCFGPAPVWNERVGRMVQELRPDVVLGLGVSEETAAMIRAAKQHRIPAIVWFQSNADLDSGFLSDTEFRNPYGVTSADGQLCLTQSDRLICQTNTQLELLRRQISRPVDVIQNPIDSRRFGAGRRDMHSRTSVLWIGRYDRFHKRPLLALEVARMCPQIPFLFVVNSGDSEVREEVLSRLPGNVTLMDYLPNSEMPDTFRSARLFLSTGAGQFEGFPNVLLEAAASGTPICSLEDFDGFINASHSGAFADGDLSRLAVIVQEFWSDNELWKSCSAAGVEYVARNHSLTAVAGLFERVLDDTMQRYNSEELTDARNIPGTHADP